MTKPVRVLRYQQNFIFPNLCLRCNPDGKGHTTRFMRGAFKFVNECSKNRAQSVQVYFINLSQVTVNEIG